MKKKKKKKNLPWFLLFKSLLLNQSLFWGRHIFLTQLIFEGTVLLFIMVLPALNMVASTNRGYILSRAKNFFLFEYIGSNIYEI